MPQNSQLPPTPPKPTEAPPLPSPSRQDIMPDLEGLARPPGVAYAPFPMPGTDLPIGVDPTLPTPPGQLGNPGNPGRGQGAQPKQR